MPIRSPLPDLEIPEMSFHEYIFSCIKKRGKDAAIIDNHNGQTLTFNEIYTKSRKLAATLFQNRLKRGDVVGICAPSCVEYIVVFIATSSCGAALTTCNPDFTVGEILLEFRQSKPVMVFAHAESIHKLIDVSEQLGGIKHIFTIGKIDGFVSLKELIDSADEDDFPKSVAINPKHDLLLLPHSSGTTGLPKCIMHTHYSTIAYFIIMSAGFHTFKSSCFYCERPMFNFGGLVGLMNAFIGGINLVIDSHFDIDKFLTAVENYKITHCLIVPSDALILAKCEIPRKYDTSSLEYVLCAGAPLGMDVLSRLSEKIETNAFNKGYGLTECMISMGDPRHNRNGSSGVILFNTEVKVIDIVTARELNADQEGEILAKGPQQTMGYYGNPDATSRTIDEDGWLHTGDIGKYDTDGLMYITGRLKEVIKFKSLQVTPAEIEDVLLKHPKILDVGVIGIPDPEAGEIPRAMVVRKDESLTENDVKKLVEKELTDYKHLRGGVQFIDIVPKSILGKILRKELERMIYCHDCVDLLIYKLHQRTGEGVVTTTCRDVDGDVLAEELQALKISLPTNVAEPQALFEYLVVNNRFTAFSNYFLL